MSANAPGRPKADPNETKASKLGRLAGPRITKALTAIAKIGDLGALLHAYGKENPSADLNAVIQQMKAPVIQELQKAIVRLETGEVAENVFQLKL